MLKNGQTIDITLENLAYGGDAVGRYQGLAVFVPYGVPGDKVKVKVTEPHKTYCRALIQHILHPSLHRINPDCRFFGECGSCQWQMMGYEYQLEKKADITRDIFKRIGGIDVPEVELLPHSRGWNYRNKAQYPVQSGRTGNLMGYYRPKSHQIMAIDSCPLLEEKINKAFVIARETINRSGIKGYFEKEHGGNLRHLIFRYSRYQDALSLVLVTRYKPDLSKIAGRLTEAIPSLRSVWQNINTAKGNSILGPEWVHLKGEEYLTEKIGDVRYRLSPGSFMQSNLETAASVYKIMADVLGLSPNDEVVDLYSGIGSIALQLAGKAGKVVAVEEYAPAVEDAKINAKLNGINNCEFICGLSEKVMARIEKADAVVLDPPRQGALPDVTKAIIKLAPGKVAYMSCNPSTLARDAGILIGGGYRLQRLYMADMFPQTYHIENLAIFSR